MRAYSSTDGGATWTFDATFSGSQTAADKQMMWVDHSPSSSFQGNIYVIWHNGQPAFVNRRTGPAGAWQTPIQVSGSETTGTAIGSDIKTNRFGDVFAFWPDTGSRKLLVAKSTDGGITFSQPGTIATAFGAFTIAVPALTLGTETPPTALPDLVPSAAPHRAALAMLLAVRYWVCRKITS